jgi:hypothetical protein
MVGGQPWRKVLDTPVMYTLVPQLTFVLSPWSLELLPSDFIPGNSVVHNMR